MKRRDALVLRRDRPATVFTRRDRPTPFVLYKIKEREGGDVGASRHIKHCSQDSLLNGVAIVFL